MTVHYHGTPITPARVLAGLAGRHFCVSHANPQDVAMAHRIGQSVMLDNGAFSKWQKELRAKEKQRIKATVEAIIVDGEIQISWDSYYEWCDEWLAYPTTWAVIPDVIDGGSQLQDALMREWPFGHRGAPVWHMDEPIHRLLALCDAWPRVCVGSTAEFRVVLSDPWCARIDEAFEAVSARHRHLPWLHMLRGMQLAGKRWPFASVDSTDVAQNHNRGHRNGGALTADMPPHDQPETRAQRMAAAWDAKQCPAVWSPRPQQTEMQLRIVA